MQGNQTIFTIDLHCEQEEKIVNKMLHFVHQILETYHAENEVFKNFILSGCYQLIYLSVVGSTEYFSKEYLVKIEKYLPVTYPFLENMLKNRIVNQNIKVQDKYMKILDEMIY